MTEAGESSRRSGPDAGQIGRPGLIVFTSSAAILILELVAERVAAPIVGISLYTWTAIIGVVLAGMSLGYFVGGRIADRWASHRSVGIVFVAGGVASLIVIPVSGWVALVAGQWPLLARILLVIGALFLLPAALLGTVPPMVAKLSVRSLQTTGRSVGGIYAAGTAGSIAGTLATGFVLVPLLDSHTIVWSVAAVLLAVGLLLFARGGRRGRQALDRRADTLSVEPGDM